ncbi:MAG: UDP-N-acetylmuramate dehydrogenase [Patescibacteria group bacterium]
MKKKIKEDYPLADETTFKIGGKAEFFLAVESKKELEEAIKEAQRLSTPVTILGGGSNVVVSSEGLSGLVIKLRSGKIEFLSEEENIIKVDAGVSLPRLAKFTFENNLSGLEWAMGVPGSLGGAVYGNAGAFGQCISDVIQEVEVMEDGETKVLKKEELNFNYRNSTFKERNLTILCASLKLVSDDQKAIKERIDDWLAYRNENHPMDMPCAGSVFKNPETTIDDPELIDKYPLLKEFNEKQVISAGFLIEKSNLKGVSVGGVKVSEKHANFIVNEGNASSQDVKNLIKKIKEEVFERFGVNLEREIRFID